MPRRNRAQSHRRGCGSSTRRDRRRCGSAACWSSDDETRFAGSGGRLHAALGLMPRVVGPETPKMALGIATGIKPTPIVLILDLHDDLGAGRFGAHIMRIGILDDNVGALGPDAAGFPRRPDPL